MQCAEPRASSLVTIASILCDRLQLIVYQRSGSGASTRLRQWGTGNRLVNCEGGVVGTRALKLRLENTTEVRKGRNVHPCPRQRWTDDRLYCTLELCPDSILHLRLSHTLDLTAVL